MQRYDERAYGRRHFEDDDHSWSGRYADEDREHWRRGDGFGEGRQEPFGRRSSGGYGQQPGFGQPFLR